MTHKSCAFLVILTVALTQLLWCIDYHEQRWRGTLPSILRPPPEVGEGLIIQRNGLGYYAWLRTLLVDHDWSFDNEFDEHNPLNHYVPPPTYRTPIGHRANQWSVGPACAWAPTVVPGHLALAALEGRGSPWAANGYSLPYQLMVGGTSLFYSALGVVFLFGICRWYARPMRAALATALLSLGTTSFYYSSIEITSAHGLGLTALAGLTWYWLATYGSLRPGRWFFVGILLGAAVLTRWQLATFLTLPIGEAVCRFRWDRLARPWALVVGLALSAAGAAFAVLPQLIAWRCVYGSWLVTPVQGIKYNFIHPSFWDVLFSADRSLFYWTPVAGIAFLSGLAGLGHAKPTRASTSGVEGASSAAPQLLLFIAFLVQVYVLASMWGMGECLPSTNNFAGIFLARAFGFRHLTESIVVLAPGLAWAFERLRPRWFRRAALLGLVLVSWNLTLVALHTNELISQHKGMELTKLWGEARNMVTQAPLVLIQILEGPLLLGVLVILCPEPEPVADGPRQIRRREQISGT